MSDQYIKTILKLDEFLEKRRKSKAHLINSYWKYLKCTPETHDSTFREWQLSRNCILSAYEVDNIEKETEERFSRYLENQILQR